MDCLPRAKAASFLVGSLVSSLVVRFFITSCISPRDGDNKIGLYLDNGALRLIDFGAGAAVTRNYPGIGLARSVPANKAENGNFRT